MGEWKIKMTITGPTGSKLETTGLIEESTKNCILEALYADFEGEALPIERLRAALECALLAIRSGESFEHLDNVVAPALERVLEDGDAPEPDVEPLTYEQLAAAHGLGSLGCSGTANTAEGKQ